MSGHSKWSTIKRKKGALDAKRGKIFTKLIKEITVAARIGGSDPEANARLRIAIENSKAQNMPKDNIERAIKKASMDPEGSNYLELDYEGYGPSGVAVYVECLSDNKNRAVAEMRHIFSKYGGSLGETGSVAWMFERRGIISLPAKNKTEEEVMEIAIEAGADDIQTEDDFFEITTSVENLDPVRQSLVKAGLEIENSAIQWVAKNTIDISGEEVEKVMKLIDMLEDSDDVQNVYTNAKFN